MRIIKIVSVFGIMLCFCLSGCQKNDIQITKDIAEEIALDDMNIKSDEVENLESKPVEDGFAVSYIYKNMNLDYLINNNGTIEHSSMTKDPDFEDDERDTDKESDEEEKVNSKEEEEEPEFSISKNDASVALLNYIGITEDLAENLKTKKDDGYYEVSLTYAGVPYLLYVDGVQGTVSELPPEE